VEISNWLNSGLPAFIRGARLVPRTDPDNENLPYAAEGTQGRVYYLVQQDNNREWVLKKFNPKLGPDRAYLVAVRSLVPRAISCMAATKRVILNADDLKAGNNLYSSPELAGWLQDVILMPKVRGKSWKEVAGGIRQGQMSLSLGRRIEFAKSLADTVCNLEDNGCAHRDLSHQNVFLDLQEYIIYLVDFDSLFHGSLYFHKNTPPGTEGYLAPWVIEKGGSWDSRKSWHRNGDRFALAVMIAEFLLASTESPSYYDGALFSQEMFFNPRHASLLRTTDSLHKIAESLGDLFYKATNVTSYDECPAPNKWRDALSSVVVQDPEAAAAAPAGEAESEEAQDRVPEDAGEQDQREETEIVNIRPATPMSRFHYWLLLLIILLPFIFAGLYYLKQYWQASQQDVSTAAIPVQTGNKGFRSEREIPAVTITSPGQEGVESQTRKYLITVRYADNDLKMMIEEKKVELSKDNSIWVTMAPGEYKVTLIFTGLIFLENGTEKRTEPVKQDRPVKFGQEDKVVLQINRKDKTWYLVSSN
jgi:serine/threonine protein kinase